MGEYQHAATHAGSLARKQEFEKAIATKKQQLAYIEKALDETEARERSPEREFCTCPSCQQLLLNLDDGCGTCGWTRSQFLYQPNDTEISSRIGDKGTSLISNDPMVAPVQGEIQHQTIGLPPLPERVGKGKEEAQSFDIKLPPEPDLLLDVVQPTFTDTTSSRGNPSLLTERKKPTSGWLEKYTKNKKLKNGVIATYPRVEGVRDPDNLEHWFWSYRYEEKNQKAKSNNGFITRTIYLPKNKVEAVRLAIGCGWSVEKLLQFLRGHY